MIARFRLLLLCLLGTLLSAGTAAAQQAPGFYFAAEGGGGYRFAEVMVPFTYQAVPTTNPDGPGPDWTIPDIANRALLTGRLEFGGVAGIGAAGFVRLGTTLSGWVGFNGVHADAYGATVCRFEDDHVVCHGTICKYGGEPCTRVDAQLVESYREVMPGLFLGYGLGRAASFAIGVQPFVGWASERAYSRRTNLEGTGFQFIDDLDGRAVGILGAAELTVALSDRLRLSLSGGAGPYRFAATSLITQQNLSLGTVTSTFDTPGELALTGLRGQLGIGLSREVSDRIELGWMARADYWSAFPRMAWIYMNPTICDSKSDGEHTVTHCQVGKPEGMHELTADPLLILSAGFRLTVHLGD